jgi:hypothetical protein
VIPTSTVAIGSGLLENENLLPAAKGMEEAGLARVNSVAGLEPLVHHA